MFGPKHDSDYYAKQLQEISKNKDELLQDFCNRVSLLANKDYPFCSVDMNKYGTDALIKDCNSEVTIIAILSHNITAKTIEEDSDMLHDIENRSKYFQVQDNSLRLWSLPSNSPHGRDCPPETSSLSWDRRSSEGGSRDYSPCNLDSRNNIPGTSSPK